MTITLSCGCTFNGPVKMVGVEYDEEEFSRCILENGEPEGYIPVTAYATWCEKCVKELGPKMDGFKIISEYQG